MSTALASRSSGPPRCLEQVAVQLQRLLRWGDPEVVSKPDSEPLENQQRVGRVSFQRERVHHESVTALPVGVGLDQRPRRPLRGAQLRSGQTNPARRERLERSQRAELVWRERS